MEILKYNEINIKETIKRSEQDVNNVLNTVNEILNNIKENGDESLKYYTEKFDNVLIDDLKVSDEEVRSNSKTSKFSRLLYSRRKSSLSFINTNDRYSSKNCGS